MLREHSRVKLCSKILKVLLTLNWYGGSIMLRSHWQPYWDLSHLPQHYIMHHIASGEGREVDRKGKSQIYF